MRLVSHSKIKFGFWIISAIIIGVFSVSFFLKNIGYEKTTKPYENTAIAIESLTAKETTPKYFYSIKDPKNLNQKPKVSAEAYLVGDLDTGEIILTKNCFYRYRIDESR